MAKEPVRLSGYLLTQDRNRIAYEHYDGGRNQVIIIAHGFFVSKASPLLKSLKDKLVDIYDVIMFDFRGHGKSEGLFSWTAKEGFDLKAILGYARKKYKRVGLIAFSLGASISINVLADCDSVDSFICVSAPSELRKIEFRFWELDLENDVFYNLGEGKTGKGVRLGPFWLKKQKPIEAIKKIKCPVLYIHGDKDWVVGSGHSKRLYENTKTRKEIKIIEGGPHAEYLLRKGLQNMVKLIKEWFWETIGEE